MYYNHTHNHIYIYTQVIQLPTCESLYQPPPPTTSPLPAPAGNPPKINSSVHKQQLHLLPAIYQRNIYYQNELLICLSRILTTTLTQTYTAYNTTLTPTLTPKPAADSTTVIQSSSTSSVKPSASYTASDVTQWQTLIDSNCRYLSLLYHYYYTSDNNNNNNSNSNSNNSTTTAKGNNNSTSNNSSSIAVSPGPKPENFVLLVQSGTVILSIVSFLMNAVSCDISILYNTITTTDIHTTGIHTNSSSSNRVVSYSDLDTIVNHVLSLLINLNNDKQISLSDVRSTRITINRYNSSVLLLVLSSMSVWENNASFCHNFDLFEKVCYTHILLYTVHMYCIVLYCIILYNYPYYLIYVSCCIFHCRLLSYSYTP